MKLFLAHSAPINPNHDSVVNHFLRFSVNIIPEEIRPVNDANSEITELCNKLRQRLQTSPESDSESSTLLLSLGVWYIGEDSIGLKVMSGPVTSALVELFGQEFKIQVQLLRPNLESGSGGSIQFSSAEMKFGQYGDYICEDVKFLTRADLIGDRLQEKWTIVVICNGKMRVYRKMLQGEVGSDLVIIPDNGKEVKAHKCVLMTHSSVFNAMFLSDMQEAKTSTVEMADMSEDGVRGLLAYLYCWETIEPNAKPEVAVEMFYAGHKYDIPVLEAEMKELLLGKPDKWYDVDVAVKLFLMGRNLPVDGKCLKMKAIQVMKGNVGNFKNSPTYVALFKEDPEAAMEFCECLAS